MTEGWKAMAEWVRKQKKVGLVAASWFQHEDRLIILFFISITKDLLKIKLECSVDTFYNKVINEFA